MGPERAGPARWSRPLCLCVSQGYWVHLTKVTQAGVVSRHRHPAPVHGFVLHGRWRYLERNRVATAGPYLFEPPGEGNTIGSTDVFDRAGAARKHGEAVGLGADYVKRFIR